MKNVQVIDGAMNCTYDIFGLPDFEFRLMFPGGADIEFAGDFIARVGKTKARAITTAMWKRPIDKKVVQGLHGTLFYELDHKKAYYPTKKEAKMVVKVGGRDIPMSNRRLRKET